MLSKVEWRALHRERWGLGDRRKCAIVGFCDSSRGFAPYADPTFEVWGLNRGYLFQKRADRWFEMHGENIWTSQQRRPGRHVDWLNAFHGPVYMHQPFEVQQCVVYPLKEITDDLFPDCSRVGQTDAKNKLSHPEQRVSMTEAPYISSSIAYEIALAIYEEFEEIHLYGVDLNTEAEYAWQKPGVEFLLGLAAGRGIRVVLPDNCPLLKGTLYGRGFLSAEGEQMSYEQLASRLKSLQHDAEQVTIQIARLQGARTELVEYVQAQMVPGVDHEVVENRRKQMEQQLHAQNMRLHTLNGALQETSYWLHQTMRGQEPDEAIQQLDKMNQRETLSEGPITDFEEITHRDGAAPMNGYAPMPPVEVAELVGAE